jgi:hypothetical protein
MTRVEKVAIAGMLMACALVLCGLRIGERLSCAVVEGGQGLSCERIRSTLFSTTAQHIWVPDTRTIELTTSSRSTPVQNDMHAPAIVAHDESGRSVILLGVAERNMVDAQVLAGRLHAASAAIAGPITFRRDASRSVWLMFGVCIAATALYATLALRRARLRAYNSAA